jgi:Domain of unknown function (DUF4276)
MHLVVFVEEESAEQALRVLLPKILGQGQALEILRFNGKPRLLRELPKRLRGYRRQRRDDLAIVVMVDRDRQDCRELKEQLETSARQAGFATPSSPDGRGRFQVVNRIAVEELEAWFFGDVEALCAAYPGVPENLDKRRGFRDPDAIAGGTWEALERVLKDAGHHRAGLAKVRAARDVAGHMQPERNRSASFQSFCGGIRGLAAQRTTTPPGTAPTVARRPVKTSSFL